MHKDEFMMAKHYVPFASEVVVDTGLHAHAHGTRASFSHSNYSNHMNDEINHQLNTSRKKDPRFYPLHFIP